MYLSKLYSNQSSLFEPINFNDGFNVVLGQIRHPENYKKDTHNLGKTTLAKVLDFLFLAKRDKKQFLFKNFNVFKSFVFYLEIKLSEFKYITIKRSVEKNTKISFKLHENEFQDFSNLPDTDWTHNNVSLDQAKILLDGWLHFDALSSWKYRNILGYLVRTQNDFNNVFRLQKQIGKDIYWKPYMADLLGFDGKLAIKNYEKQEEVQKIEALTKPHKKSNLNLHEELSKIDGKILIRKSELDKIEVFVNDFNFNPVDQEAIENLVSSLDDKIAQLNMLEYTIKNNIARIENSLNADQIKFNTNKVKKLFDEACILFPDQLVKDFDQLIDFNKKITEERNHYLIEELSSLQKDLTKTQARLAELNIERSNQIKFLGETEIVRKFKKSNHQLAQIKADIEFLIKQKEEIQKILQLDEDKKILNNQLNKIQHDMQSDMYKVSQDITSTFSQIRIYFNEIISTILDKEGSITVFLNKEGNFEFEASYRDKNGLDTNEADGHSYKKLLCFAFDLAVSRAYLDKNYPNFLYIDGIFDNLDIRKKKNTLDVIRTYSNMGLQIIITTIESEISELLNKDFPVFNKSEIILTLHDGDDTGRLFKMPIW